MKTRLHGRLLGGPIPYRGRQATSRIAGLPGKRFVLREDVPDGLGQLARPMLDPGDLGATLASEAFLVSAPSDPDMDICEAA